LEVVATLKAEVSSELTASAFSAIYREHFPYVWAVLRRLGTPDEDLEDLVQETFVVVHRRWDDFEGRSSVRTWLYGIALRVFWNDRRRRASRPHADPSALGTIDAGGLHDPEDFTARRQANALLHQLLSNLDDDKRTVFVLSELEGMTAPAIAEVTGAPTRTVYSRLRAARDRFSADLRRAQVREENAVRARELLRHGGRGDRPPAGAERRVMASLMAAIPQLAAPTSAAVLGGWGLAKIATASLGLGAAGLVVLAVGARLVQAEPTSEPVKAPSVEAVPAAVATASPSPVPAPVARDSPTVEVPEPPPPAATTRIESKLDPLGEELVLMGKIRDALKSTDSKLALDLLDEHARRFPDGRFALERRRSRVTALCQAGRREEAETIAARLGLDVACPSRRLKMQPASP
jgi:RNA polymerase sigma-70 factor (ECF subfamily)